MKAKKEDEKELIDLFRKMDIATRNLFLSHGRIALVAEEAGKKAALENMALFGETGTVRDTAFIMPDAGPVMGAQA